jgi:hypothetical protein
MIEWAVAKVWCIAATVGGFALGVSICFLLLLFELKARR